MTSAGPTHIEHAAVAAGALGQALDALGLRPRVGKHLITAAEPAILAALQARAPGWKVAAVAWQRACESWWALAEGALDVCWAEAIRRRGRGIEVEDLAQEGLVGAYLAAQRWEPDRRVAYRQIVGVYVRRQQDRALARARIVATPVDVFHLEGHALRLREYLERRGRPFDLAAEMGVDRRQLELLEAAAVATSLEAPIGHEGFGRLADVLAAPEPEEHIRPLLDAAIERLEDPRQRRLLRLVLEGLRPEQIAFRLQVKRTRFFQLQRAAIDSLREVLRDA